MGFLSRLFAPPQTGRAPQIIALTQAVEFEDLRDPRLAAFLAGSRMTASGVWVSEKLALRNPAVFRSMSIISGSVGMLPLHLMRRLEGDNAEKAREHPLFNILHRKPNSYQTASEFKSFMQYAALADGNAYALIIRNALGKIVALIPLKRGSVQPLLDDAWEPIFRYTRASGGTVDLGPGEVFHFRAPMSIDGLRGLSLFDMAAEAVGIAVQAEKAAARLFKHGSLASGSLRKEDGTLSDEAYNRLKESFEENYAGAENAGKPLILEEGLKYEPIAPTPVDAQHLETRKFQAEEVSRITGVPRPLLMFDETSWGSGIEQLGQFFITYCLQPWLTAWEEAVFRSCLTVTEQANLFAKFNAGALLRGSLKDQADFLSKALGAGGSQPWLTPNEAREIFDLNDVADGDVLPQRINVAAPPATQGTTNAA